MKRMLCVGMLAFTVCTGWSQEPVAAHPASAASLQGLSEKKARTARYGVQQWSCAKKAATRAIRRSHNGADGKWVFPTVSAGRYRLITTCPGYVSAEYGQKRMNGPGFRSFFQSGNRCRMSGVEMVPTGQSRDGSRIPLGSRSSSPMCSL